MSNKKVCFFIEEKEFIDFKLRLRHDGFTQSQFISAIIGLYLRNNRAFQKIVEEISDFSKFGTKRRTETMKNYKKGTNVAAQYDPIKDADAVYDILKRELGDL
jgi:hypothetical protein